MIVTIDGPSGAGKGTMAKKLAWVLGCPLLDSGAVYRVLALAVDRAGIALDDAENIVELSRKIEISFNDGVKLNGEDVSDEIRTERIGGIASEISAIPIVREALLALQRSFAKDGGLVADGRDMGTVVFPEAEIKFFLTASAEDRASRRCKQLVEIGLEADYDKILEDIKIRDDRDTNRAVAPLKPAEDAVVVDSTGKAIEEVFVIMGAKIWDNQMEAVLKLFSK